MTHKEKLEALYAQLIDLGNPYMAHSVQKAIKEIEEKGRKEDKG